MRKKFQKRGQNGLPQCKISGGGLMIVYYHGSTTICFMNGLQTLWKSRSDSVGEDETSIGQSRDEINALKVAF